MDQTNLDAMFEDMLGELDIISQQLEEQTEKPEPPKPTPVEPTPVENRVSSNSGSSAAVDHEVDVDLSAMLNDLSDWEHNLAPPQVHVSSKSSQDESHDSGFGFNNDSLPRDTNKLSAHQYGLDVSPQFNTLKRSMTDGPSVTFGEDDDGDLSLASLQKDIEEENRKKDKSRQLSAEELASLSPVMQELDDLVSDLSNLSFDPLPGFEKKASRETEHDLSSTVVTSSLIQSTLVSSSHNEDGSDSTSTAVSHTETVNTVEHQFPHPSNETFSEQPKQANHITERSMHHTLTANESSSSYKGVVSNEKPLPPIGDRNSQEHSSSASSPRSRNMVLNAAKLFENEARNQTKQNTSYSGGLNQVQTCSLSDSSNMQPRVNKSKPPVPPPPASKPKLPEKPQTINLSSHRHRSASTPITPKPTTPVKRQPSVKAPANLTNILERQLQQHSSPVEKQTSPTRHFQGVPSSSPSVTSNTEVIQRQKSLIRQNSAEAKMLTPESYHSLGRKHSTSLVSVESNFSTASSVTSVKSNSSADSASSDFSRHSADCTNDLPEDIKMFLNVIHKQADVEQLTPEARDERIKAEKMRIALEKLKEARIQKLVVKVFNKDDSSKTLMVDERMTTRSVIKQLLEKNHYEPSVNWTLVEELPSLFMERIFEEHESVTEMLSYWTRDTTNQVRFLERKDKYALFRNPQHYLLSVSDTEGQMAERQKQTLIEEFFSGRSGSGVPEVQGILYIKGESKSWSRKYCVLRNSGLYCSKSGEPKKGKKVSDLQCLVMFEQVCVYLGRGWKKKHKSPTDYGFALKHPAIQTKSKHIRYFCCDDVRSLMRWIVGIRCAKYGKQLKDNFDKTNAEMKVLADTPTMPYRAPQPDTTSNASADSAESEPKPAVPRASITNMFGGAWQRANQQESGETPVEGGGLQRGKSVWNPVQSKTNSNWWDLGASPELEELAGNTPTAPGPANATPSSVEANLNHTQDAQLHAPPSPPAYSNSSALPPPPPAYKVTQPPPPPMKISVPPSHRGPVQPGPNLSAKGPPPPPPAKNLYLPPRAKIPPAPPAKPIGKRPMPHSAFPPPPGPKPMLSSGPLPPPPMDDLPPPPPMDDMPPPPPMQDLPPPPDDDMPLPPPMELSPNPGLPKGLRGVDGQPPVRLPFLPMFKNGNPMANLRHTTPGSRPRGPHSASNFNSSNNKPPLLSRTPQNQGSQRMAMNDTRYIPPTKPAFQAPLTDYYTSNATHGMESLYSKNSLPPPQDFVTDLKDAFHHVAGSSNSDPLLDLPPPPPELLLSEVRSRSPYTAVKSAKPAPPPPRRSPSTRLSFKR